MTEDELRAEFARLLPLRWDTQKANDAFEVKRLAAILGAVQVDHPKVKDLKKAEKVAPEVVGRVREEWEKKAEAIVSRHTRWREARDRRLIEIACQVAPRSTPGIWTRARTIWPYNTQGWGANSYAEGRAEIDAETVYRVHGLAARVVRVETPGSLAGSKPMLSWVIEVEADPLDCEIAARRPRQDGKDEIAEFVRACWKRALNPRVYLPFLPHGFEEKHGIGWDGSVKVRVGSPSAE